MGQNWGFEMTVIEVKEYTFKCDVCNWSTPEASHVRGFDTRHGDNRLTFIDLVERAEKADTHICSDCGRRIAKAWGYLT